MLIFRVSTLPVLALSLLYGLHAQQATAHRPPAVPLIANDPYFSVWSMADKLTDAPTKHWSEAAQPMTGLVRIDGKLFRWMGVQPRLRERTPAAEPMQQISVEMTPLHSRYRFSAGGIALEVSFFTPLFPGDLDVLSRPVTYLSWAAQATDGGSHQVEVLLDVAPQIAVNEGAQPVTWGRSHTTGLTLLNVGSRDQAPLHQSGDRIRIDWGYFHLGIPDAAGARTELSADAMAQFAQTGTLGDSDDLDMPRGRRQLKRSSRASRGGALAGDGGSSAGGTTCVAGVYGGLCHRVFGPKAAAVLATQRNDRAGDAGGG